MASMTAQLNQCKACDSWEGIFLLYEFCNGAVEGKCQKFISAEYMKKLPKSAGTSDGSTASYYELPAGAAQLQDLISHRNMNAQLGEIFRACYRYGLASHSDQLRDAKKIKFYIDAEIARLQKLGGT